MTPAELLQLLQEFYRGTLDLYNTRLANARAVGGYDANNAYQQVIGRQDVHLRWIADAIADLDGSTVDSPQGSAGTTPARDGRALIESDALSQQAFMAAWAPRVETVTNARNRKMLQLILGEMQEHLRLLQQAAEGRSDLLGRHADGKVLRGRVIAARPKN